MEKKLADEYYKNFSNLKDYLRIINYDKKSLSCWHLLIVEINFKKLKIDYEKFYLLLKKGYKYTTTLYSYLSI